MVQKAEATAVRGVELIRAGSLKLDPVQIGEHRSAVAEILVVGDVEQGRVKAKLPDEVELVDLGPVLTVGMWKYDRGDLPFEMICSEVKMVLEGKLVVKDENGVIHRAGPGDMMIFRAPVNVTFMAETKCLIFYAVHRTTDTI